MIVLEFQLFFVEAVVEAVVVELVVVVVVVVVLCRLQNPH